MTFYTGLLSVAGDPIEIEGVTQCGLGEIFPRYAEFWAKYVFPNREQNDKSKLRSGFPVEIENICNNHYYVFYQLATALRQLKALPHPLLDIGDPLSHLATAIDLVERTFLASLQVKCKFSEEALWFELDKDSFLKEVEEFWSH